MVKLLCTSVAIPQLLRNAFDDHMRSEGNRARYNSTLLKHHVQLAAVNSHVDQPAAPQDLARTDLWDYRSPPFNMEAREKHPPGLPPTAFSPGPPYITHRALNDDILHTGQA